MFSLKLNFKSKVGAHTFKKRYITRVIKREKLTLITFETSTNNLTRYSSDVIRDPNLKGIISKT